MKQLAHTWRRRFLAMAGFFLVRPKPQRHTRPLLRAAALAFTAGTTPLMAGCSIFSPASQPEEAEDVKPLYVYCVNQLTNEVLAPDDPLCVAAENGNGASYIYIFTSYRGDYKKGDKLPLGAKLISFKDQGARTASGLPATGKVTNLRVTTGGITSGDPSDGSHD